MGRAAYLRRPNPWSEKRRRAARARIERQKAEAKKTGFFDKDGAEIEYGDVVASMVTINFEAFRGFSFSTEIVKHGEPRMFDEDYEGGPILDGVYGACPLEHRDPEELKKLDGDTDLRKLHSYFLQRKRELGLT